MVERDASDLLIGAILSQRFEEAKIHLVAFISKQFSAAKLNYQIYNKDMLPIVYAMKTWRYYLQGILHTTSVFSDHMNLQYIKETNQLNRRQARWGVVLQEYHLKIVYQKGTANGKAAALVRCPEFISREEGTTSTMSKALLRPEIWLEIGVTDIEDDDFQEIALAGFVVKQLTPANVENWKNEIDHDAEYRKILRTVQDKEQNVDDRISMDAEGRFC